eukprot:scaffold965_cov344-Prasinococcus_capsulatus_cf.AAC.3
MLHSVLYVGQVDKRRLLELEEEKRKAEQDRIAVITDLQTMSHEFMQEKEEKQKLEEQIQRMQSQLLTGGSKIEESPAFQQRVEIEHRRIRGEYESKLADMERERLGVLEDKARHIVQSTEVVEGYKRLLLRQRDIMNGLALKLQEKDNQIRALESVSTGYGRPPHPSRRPVTYSVVYVAQDLEEFDLHQRELEDALDSKTEQLFRLHKAAMELSREDGVSGPDWGQTAIATQENKEILNGESGTSSMALATLQDKFAKLSMEHEQLKVRAVANPSMLGIDLQEQTHQALKDKATAQEKETNERLQRECDTYQDELAAVQKILQSKVLVLVEKLRVAEKARLRSAGVGSAQTSKELTALRALVSDTVDALQRRGQ